jgi:hypothetical protein
MTAYSERAAPAAIPERKTGKHDLAKVVLGEPWGDFPEGRFGANRED